MARQLRLPEARVRCIAPDVGGGFGVKGHVYCEEIIVPFLARELGRPVAWIEDRQENLLNSTHSRDDIHDAEIVFDDHGVIHALKDDLIVDSDAYAPAGVASMANIAAHICGPYRVPNFEFGATMVVTNKTPNAPYRGTGRPEGSFVIERLIDLMARELAIDPVDARQRNRPLDMSGGLESTEYFEPRTVTWAYGTHVGIIEILADTGAILIHKYVVAHDAGILINPMIANGQIMGGVCQGIGGCLLEQVVYDGEGQNLTGSLMDYLIPVAAQMPPIEILHTETPSPQNELGIKGLGEGGVVGPPAVIINGACDALRPFGFEINRSLYSQADVLAALTQARLSK